MKNSSETSLINRVCALEIRGLGWNIPSFKNKKHSGVNRNTGERLVYTETKTKRKMAALENAILCALYSASRTIGSGTDSECLKQLRTALSGLSDDSLREIPEFSFGSEQVESGREGVDIIIAKL